MSNPKREESKKTLEALLLEKRRFPPPKAFARTAHVSSPAVYKKADRDFRKFWEGFAKELDWIRPWKKVLDWNPPDARWFVGGKLNASANCLDRHLLGPRKNKAALVWEGEPGDQRTLTYRDLHREVCRFANVLKRLGVKKGDRVALYLPMIPELPVAMLACARIGAIHSVVFGGFSAESLRDRISSGRRFSRSTSAVRTSKSDRVPTSRKSRTCSTRSVARRTALSRTPTVASARSTA